MNCQRQTKLSPLNEAVIRLRNQGKAVFASDIPGLFRVNDGPEITSNQLIELAFGLTARLGTQ